MKLLRTLILFALAAVVPALFAPTASADENIYLKSSWLRGANRTSPWKADSTFRSFRWRATDLASVARSDTFYLNLSDAAFNQPWYPLYGGAKYPSPTVASADSLVWGTNRSYWQARDTTYAFTVALFTDNAATDLDSLSVTVAVANHQGLPSSLQPNGSLLGFPGLTTGWQTLTGVGALDMSTSSSTAFNYSTSNDASARMPNGNNNTAIVPWVNATVSRTVLKRGINLVRVIVTNNSGCTSGTGVRYGVRLTYPAVIGFKAPND